MLWDEGQSSHQDRWVVVGKLKDLQHWKDMPTLTAEFGKFFNPTLSRNTYIIVHTYLFFSEIRVFLLWFHSEHKDGQVCAAILCNCFLRVGASLMHMFLREGGHLFSGVVCNCCHPHCLRNRKDKSHNSNWTLNFVTRSQKFPNLNGCWDGSN